MRTKQFYALRFVVLIALMVSLTVLSSRMKADTGNCGGVTITLPFTDVMASPFFCQIAAAYFSGLANGTTATTYSPGANVTREQMAAFVTRTMDQSLKRGSERAVTEKWWTPQSENAVALTSVGTNPRLVQSDGTDLWVANIVTETISRVRASDGKVIGTWTGATSAYGVLVAMGKVFVTGHASPGKLYQIDPTQPPGAVTTLSTGLGNLPVGITFDGARIWTANFNGSVSIITLNPTTVTNISTGFISPWGVLYDGANIWVADSGDDKLKKLDSSGAILQSVSVGDIPRFPVFDGTNIWVPNSGSDTVTVVRVKDSQGNPLANPFVLATLGGLNAPATAAFDGERILVTNTLGGFIALWKAADLTPLGLFVIGESSLPWGACSDGPELLDHARRVQPSGEVLKFVSPALCLGKAHIQNQPVRITPMKIKQSFTLRVVLLITLMVSLTVLSSRMKADTGNCGGVTITLPFTDVMASPFFCQIAAAYFSGLANGTTATTYSPGANVTREQMAAFTTRTMDQSLKRGSRRAALNQWWTPQNANSLTLTNVGIDPRQVKFDGTDLWVANAFSSSVMRIRPSDGKVLDTWTGATDASAIVCAMGRIFVAGRTNFGSLYMIDPTQPAGAVTTLSSALGVFPTGIAFDGSRIWTANADRSVSIVSLNPTAVTTVTTGFNRPEGMLYDGSHIWVTDFSANTLLKLNSDGSIAQTITMGSKPQYPVFDGTNIWVPNQGSASLTVVRAKDSQGNPLATPFVLATLTGNGLTFPETAAFDGERLLVTNFIGQSVSLWKAADLTPMGTFATGAGTNPFGACSDGLNFWITLNSTNKLARF